MEWRMSDWVVWLLLIAPFCAVLCVILWDARDRDKRSGLRLEKETVPIAIREWLKACGFLAASVAAMFAFWQFDLAKERAETDRRPWVSLSDFTPGHIQIKLVNHKEDGGSYTVIFSAKAMALALPAASRRRLCSMAKAFRSPSTSQRKGFASKTAAGMQLRARHAQRPRTWSPQQEFLQPRRRPFKSSATSAQTCGRNRRYTQKLRALAGLLALRTCQA
jgi:hypothetical protein